MKKLLCIIISIMLLLSLAACAPENAEVEMGIYYLTGNFEAGKTPYIVLYTDINEFYLTSGSSSKYAEKGTYEIKGNELIASSQYNTYTFDINDSKTLVLMDNGHNDYFNFQLGMEFVYGQGQIINR